MMLGKLFQPPTGDECCVLHLCSTLRGLCSLPASVLPTLSPAGSLLLFLKLCWDPCPGWGCNPGMAGIETSSFSRSLALPLLPPATHPTPAKPWSCALIPVGFSCPVRVRLILVFINRFSGPLWPYRNAFASSLFFRAGNCIQGLPWLGDSS